jgi:hypothetical protein
MSAPLAVPRTLALALTLAACQPGTPSTPDDGGAGDGASSSDAGGADASRPDVDAAPLPPQTARLRVVSACAEPIWIAHSANVPGPLVVPLAPGAYHDYDIPAGGLASVRLWPKLGCDATGHACRIGDTGEGGGAPCGPTGCQPPIDSKFEVTFAPLGAGDPTFYNLSLVDGYTLPFSVAPLGPGAEVGSCTTSDCSALTLDACPAADDLGGDVYPQYADVDLRVRDPQDPARVLGCLSPCKAWHYPAPYGLGLPEGQDPGLHLCCPTPIDPGTGQCTSQNGCISPEACRSAADPLSVVHTDFVGVVHARCPTAYAYSYDDDAGLHACSADTAFVVTFCP